MAIVIDPTPSVPADLDQRMAGFLSSHFPTGRHRPGTGEDECACGEWFESGVYGGHGRHVAAELALVIHGYYDSGRADGIRESAAMLREYCPNHGTAETSFMSCHCPAAVELDRDARTEEA